MSKKLAKQFPHAMLEYSDRLLGNIELSRYNKAANLRAEMRDLLEKWLEIQEEWITHLATVRYAKWVRRHRLQAA